MAASLPAWVNLFSDMETDCVDSGAACSAYPQ